jgi:CrcB protein
VEREREMQSRTRRAVTRAPLPHLDRQELLAVFAGGFFGAVLRGALAESVTPGSGEWPWPTFSVNIAGAILLGYAVTRLAERLPPTRYRRSFLASGLCGALTTFSTMMVELLRMLEASHWGLAAGYSSASVACGFVAVFLTTKAVRRARTAP